MQTSAKSAAVQSPRAMLATSHAAPYRIAATIAHHRLARLIVLGLRLLSVVAPVEIAAAQAAEETTDQKVARETLEKNNATFRFGLSVGWRRVVGPSSALLQDVALDPMNGNVIVDPIDRSAVVLSGVVSAFPWRNTALAVAKDPKKIPPPSRLTERLRRGTAAWRWGFLANVNVASFTQENIAVFNQTVEGGLGLAYKMNESFAVALTVERLKGRALRSFVTVGQPVKGADGKALTELLSTDSRYFRDDNLTALSAKFVYFFN